MYRRAIWLIVVLASAAPARASTWADAMFPEQSRDFGAVPRGCMAAHPFRFINKTGQTVHLASVRVSCGCTSAYQMHDTIKPGEESGIMVQMDTSRFIGNRKVTVYVTFDAPQFTEVKLTVEANSRSDLTLLPDTIAFGKIKQGHTPESSVKICFIGAGDYEIHEAQCTSHYIQLAASLESRKASEVTYVLTAKLRPDTPPGKWYTDIWLTTNQQSMPKVRIPLTVEVEGTLNLSPRVIELGEVKSGVITDRKVILRGGRPFRITEIEGTDSQIAVRETQADSKTVHVLTVTLNPTTTGELSRIIRVKTDLATGAVEFNAHAVVVP